MSPPSLSGNRRVGLTLAVEHIKWIQMVIDHTILLDPMIFIYSIPYSPSIYPLFLFKMVGYIPIWWLILVPLTN